MKLEPPEDAPFDEAFLPPLAALRAFDAVARFGTIRKAAQALKLDHGVVSRHITGLEKRTATVLVQRSHYGANLTEKGLRYHDEVKAALEAITRATRNLTDTAAVDTLDIGCSPGFAVQWLLTRIVEFEALYPKIHVELRMVDYGSTVLDQGTDVDVRYFASYGVPYSFPPLIKKMELAHPSVLAVASPGYLAELPPLERPGDLLSLNLIHDRNETSCRAWFEAQDVELAPGKLRGTKLWHSNLMLEAARRGRGIAFANRFLVQDDLEQGLLVEIGAGNPAFQRVSLGPYLLIGRADGWASPIVTKFREWLVEKIAAERSGLEG